MCSNCVGLVATIAVGAIAGATIAGTTAAASTYQQDGKVDWEAVGICAGIGGAVGAISAGVAHGITTLIKSTIQVSNAIKNTSANTQHHILQSKHQWNRIGNGSWDDASKAIKHTLNNGKVATYKSGNYIVTSSYKGETVQVVIREMDDILRIVDAWIKII